jgi:hypothetical protein
MSKFLSSFGHVITLWPDTDFMGSVESPDDLTLKTWQLVGKQLEDSMNKYFILLDAEEPLYKNVNLYGLDPAKSTNLVYRAGKSNRSKPTTTEA